jgi:hypothetical protein
VGGAIHAENDAEVDVYGSRFDLNEAEIGGAVSGYRSTYRIHASAFRGNRSTGADPNGFGGTMMFNSNDVAGATTNGGLQNRPAVSVTIESSLFQGRYSTTVFSALKGGCMLALGDKNSQDGNGGMVPDPNLAFNRATIDIRDSIFVDCDLDLAGASAPGGGAISVDLTDLNLQDSLLALNDANNGAGVRAADRSLATLTRVTLADNTTSGTNPRSAGLHVFESAIDVDDSKFLGNIVASSGAGSAMWSNQTAHPTSGSVVGTVFSGNDGLNIDEFESGGGPSSTITYTGNTFFPSGATDVYRNGLTGTATVSGLNALPGNSANVGAGSEPISLALVAAPPAIYPTNAPNDPAPPTPAFLGHAFQGGSATIDGAPETESSGLNEAGAQVHTLTVGGQSVMVEIVVAAEPTLGFSATPTNISGGQSSTLDWSTDQGTFLAFSIDRGVAVGSTVSGSTVVSPPDSMTYSGFLLTEEGGDVVEVRVLVDEAAIFADGFESGNTSQWSSATP